MFTFQIDQVARRGNLVRFFSGTGLTENMLNKHSVNKSSKSLLMRKIEAANICTVAMKFSLRNKHFKMPKIVLLRAYGGISGTCMCIKYYSVRDG